MKKALICLLLFILLIDIISAEDCSSKESDGQITDEECRNLDVEDQNHICIKGTEGCESKFLCEHKNLEGEETCASFPVSSYENKCEVRQNKVDDQSDCIETLIKCEGEIVTEYASEPYCKKLDVDDGFNCLFEEGPKKCIKTQINCGEEESGKASDTFCPKLKVAEGFKCVLDGSTCKPEQIKCGSEESGKASIDYCPKLKVNDPTNQVCIKDENENKCIVAESCAEVKIGATDSICNIFTLGEKEICIKENNSCVVKTICNGADGASNEICSGFHVSDSTKKKCVKTANEDKCEEIDKSEEEIEEANKSSNGAGQTPQDSPNKSSSTKASSSSSTKASSSSSKASQASNATPSKSGTASNKKTDEPDGAKVMNISLMLLISLLML